MDHVGWGFLVGLGVLGVGVGFAIMWCERRSFPGSRAERRLDSVLGRCVPRGSGEPNNGNIQGRSTTVAARSTGTAAVAST